MRRRVLRTLAMAGTCTVLPAQQDVADVLQRGDPIAEGLDEAALAELLRLARDRNSDALVVLKNGRLVVEEYFGKEPGPIESMSVTKSIVSLAIGHLVDTGAIASIDEPVATFFPEWDQGKKRDVTLRHVLEHTSGIQAEPTTAEIYRSPDFVQLALCADLTDDPGTRFAYNNKAVNLLAGIVRVASRERLDRYVGKYVFAPLGITDFEWLLDKAGNPHVMAGCRIRAVDLAKVGQLMVNEGMWGRERVVSARWVAMSVAPSRLQGWCGLLWWLVPAWQKFAIDDALVAEWHAAGVPESFTKKLAPLRDRALPSREFYAELEKILGADGMDEYHAMTRGAGRRSAVVTNGPAAGCSANGYLGQYLIVIPEHRLVAVRQIRRGSHREPEDGFPDFSARVRALVGME